MSIRNFTVYLRDNGLELIELLAKNKPLSFENFYDWFKIYDKTKEEKQRNVDRMLIRLVVEGIIEYVDSENIYQASPNFTHNIVELVNIGKIRYGNIYYHKRIRT